MTINNHNCVSGLTRIQTDHFKKKGWVLVDLYSQEEVAVIRECIETNSRFITDTNNQKIMTFYNNVYNMETPRDLHLFHEPLANMYKSQNLVDKLTSIAGPDLLLWYSNVFCKLPGQGEIKWHQAIEYYTSSDIDFSKKTLIYDETDEAVNLTVWVALDETDKENGCMCFANGSQHTKFEVIPGANPAAEGIFSGIGAHNTVWQTNNQYSFAYKFDESEWDTEYVPMKPGQAIIFTERTMHFSPPNISGRRRLGIIGRYVRPSTLIYPGRLNDDMIDENGHDISHHYNILVAGNDNYKRNIIRESHDLSTIQARFQTMFNRVRFGLVKIPEDMKQLQINALERQAMEGDCNTEQPNPILYPKKYVQWQAWNNLEGVTQESAMLRYSELVAQLPEISNSDERDHKKNKTARHSVNQADIESWLIAYLADTLNIASDELDVDVPLVRYGLSSVDVVRITGDLGDWIETELDPALAYDYPTIESLSRHLATELQVT